MIISQIGREIKMALLIRTKKPERIKCWACGLPIELDEPAILTPGGSGVIYMHSDCARTVGLQMIRDFAQLHDFNYHKEEDREPFTFSE